jgi:hypothetical protein
MAIEHADRILGWMENMSDDEVPPVHIWHLPDELDYHFEQVKQERKERYGGSSSDDSPSRSRGSTEAWDDWVARKKAAGE